MSWFATKRGTQDVISKILSQNLPLNIEKKCLNYIPQTWNTEYLTITKYLTN